MTNFVAHQMLTAAQLNAAFATKADVSNVYTKAEINALISALGSGAGGGGTGGGIVSQDGGTTLVVPDATNYTVGEYLAYAAPWSIYTAPQNAFVRGVEYEDTITVHPATFPNGTTINWRWPSTASSTGVYGYMQVSWGNYNNGTPQTLVTPQKISDIASLEFNVAYTLDSTPCDGNVLLEFYTTTVAGDGNAKSAEVGFFLNAIPSTIAFHQGAEQHGTWTDPQGRGWTVARDYSGDAGNFIMFLPTDHANKSGVFDGLAALNHLATLGMINTAHYVNGAAVGAEPHTGSGQLTFTTFNVALSAEPDTIPNTFLFADVTGTSASSVYTSNTITVSGITAASPISITGGTYSKNGGAYTSTAGTVVNGDTVSVRVTSGASGSTTSATLDIGGVSDTYSVTIAASGTNLVTADPGDAYWSAYEVTKTTGQADSASGTTATKLVATVVSGVHAIQKYPLAIDASVKTYRIKTRVKAAGYSWINLSVDDSAFTSVCKAYFNLGTGAVGTTTAAGTMTMGTPTITAAGNGYYDCQFTFTSTAGGGLRPILYLAAGDLTDASAGSGTNGVLVESMFIALE
jgi:hypothetical protein